MSLDTPKYFSIKKVRLTFVLLTGQEQDLLFTFVMESFQCVSVYRKQCQSMLNCMMLPTQRLSVAKLQIL